MSRRPGAGDPDVYGRTRLAGVLKHMRVLDRQASALSVSLAIHLASFALLLLAMRQAVHAPVAAPEAADRAIPRMVWLNAPGPGGGGGGGGDRTKEPARRAEMPGRRRTDRVADAKRSCRIVRVVQSLLPRALAARLDEYGSTKVAPAVSVART